MSKMKAVLAVASYIALIVIAIVECVVVALIVDCSSIMDYLIVAFIICISVGFSGYTVYEAWHKLKSK